MRLLFVSNNYEHPNKMHIANIWGLMGVSTFDFFGPGYSTEKELEAGLQIYWDEKGGYDALILDFNIVFLHSDYLDIRNAYDWHRYTLSSYSIFDAIRYADKIIEDAKKVDVVKILWYHCDTINISERWAGCVQTFLNYGFYLMGIGSEWCPEIEENEHMQIGRYSNRYRKLTLKNAEKIISIPCCTVDLSELYYHPLEKRSYDVVVPGNLNEYLYPLRSVILQKIEESQYSLYKDFYNRGLAYRDSNSRIGCTLYKCEEDKHTDMGLKYKSPYLDARLSNESIKMWRENYRVSLRNSKIGYADGGLSGQVVQKYVEIPAAGTMLISEDIPPLKNFGFKEWENIVLVTPDNVVEICDELFHNPQKMQNIADAGRRMILGKHTSVVHAEHVLEAITAIEKGQFRGTLWENGEFIILN